MKIDKSYDVDKAIENMRNSSYTRSGSQKWFEPLLARMAELPLLDEKDVQRESRSGRNRNLSDQQFYVLLLLSQGMHCPQIAKELNISLTAAVDSVREVIRKLECKNQTHAVAKAIRKGII